MGSFTYSGRDYDKEPTTFTLPVADSDALNIADQITALANVLTSLQSVSMANFYRSSLQALSQIEGPDEAAADELAQREAKAMCLYYDSVTFKPGRMEIPAVDLRLQMPARPGFFYDKRYAGEEEVAWGSFVTIIQANGVGPDGNGLVVNQIYHIGKAT